MPLTKNEVKIVLYGASVSAQSKNDSYWLYLKKWEANRNIKNEKYFDISRITFPSGFMSDAGLFNLDHLLSLDPDIVVMDWLSTEEQDCSEWIINYIYKELNNRGIFIITTAMIRLDTWNKITPQYITSLMHAKSNNQSFIDFSIIAKNRDHSWKDVTRDGVHTNELGAKLYSNILSQEIERIIELKNRSLVHKQINEQHLKENTNTQVFRHISTLSIPNEIKIHAGQELLLTIYCKDTKNAKIWCKQTVGPYTDFISTSFLKDSHILSHENIDLSDRWCIFERFAFKPLALNFPEDYYGILNISISPSGNVDSKVRLHDRICAVGCSLIGLEII